MTTSVSIPVSSSYNDAAGGDEVVSNLTGVLEKSEWIDALSKWSIAGSGSAPIDGAQFGLTSPSWQQLQNRLISTGWFTLISDRIQPTPRGRNLLAEIRGICAFERRAHNYESVFKTLARLPKGTALDLGCGAGRFLLRLARLGYKPLIGYDLAPVSLGIAGALLAREGHSAELVDKDGTLLADVPDASLSLLFSWNALQYFDSRVLAGSVNRVLRPGGYAVIEVRSWRYYLQLFRDLTKPRKWKRALSYSRTLFRTLVYEITGRQPMMGAQTPEIGWTLKSVRRFAQWAGLKIESFEPSPTLAGYVVVLVKPSENGK